MTKNKTKTIGVTIQKGGVGKTTTTIGLACRIAEQGKTVLLVDLDPQGNLSQLFDTSDINKDDYSGSHRLFEDELDVNELNFLPCNSWRTSGNNDLSQLIHVMPNFSNKLADVNALDPKAGTKVVKNPKKHLSQLKYDYIIIDSPPSLGVTQLATVASADSVVIPLKADPDFCGERALQDFMKVFKTVKQVFNKGVNISGVLVNDVDTREAVTRDYLAWAKKSFGNLLVGSIPHSAAISNAKRDRRSPWFKPSNGNDGRIGRIVRDMYDKILKKV